MCMLDEIRAKRDEIYAIARRHKAEKLWAFGSCARKEERPDSDVDFMVQYGSRYNLFDAIDLQSGLKRALGRNVDVVSISPSVALTMNAALGLPMKLERTW